MSAYHKHARLGRIGETRARNALASILRRAASNVAGISMFWFSRISLVAKTSLFFFIACALKRLAPGHRCVSAHAHLARVSHQRHRRRSYNIIGKHGARRLFGRQKRATMASFDETVEAGRRGQRRLVRVAPAARVSLLFIVAAVHEKLHRRRGGAKRKARQAASLSLCCV